MGLGLSAAVLSLVGGGARATTVHVGPGGNDNNNGLAAAVSGGNGPVATLGRALEALRSRRQGDPRSAADRIVLAPGTYTLAGPVRVGAQDSGLAGSPLVIEAAVPGTAVISGGRALAAFSNERSYWTGRLGSGTDVQMLWVDGKLARRARSPRGEGFYQGGANVRPTVPEESPLRMTRPENLENMRSVILPPEARKDLERLSTEEVHKAVLVAMHAWTSSTHQIAAYDPKTGRVDLKQASNWPFHQFGANQRFAVADAPGLLDEPGEWWLSEQGELRYLPRPGQRPANTQAVVAAIEQLVAVAGSPGNPVENVTFRGLRFRHASARAVPFVDLQAASEVPAAVTVDHARHIEFDDCAFEQVGGYALWFRRGVSDSGVRRSLFRELGAGAVRLGERGYPGGPADFTQAIRVENNLVADGGLVFPGAVGIWVGQSGENLIAHNEIRSLRYSAISVGWTWGFGQSAAMRNRIESNFIHQIGQGQLSDLGGIYMLGPTGGSVVRGNRIEDVRSFDQQGATAWGIYLDEGSSDVLVERNLVRGTTGGGFHLHYGERNIVRNNIFVDGKLAQAVRSRKDRSAMTFELNVLGAPGASPLFSGEWSDPGVSSRANLLIRRGGATPPARTASAPSGNFESADGTGEDLQCDRVNCKVQSRRLVEAGFENFSVDGAGIRERGAVLRAP